MAQQGVVFHRSADVKRGSGLLQVPCHDKTRLMRFDRPLLRRRGPLCARHGAWCAIAVSAVLTSCGGRAADGLGLEPNGSGASNPVNEPTVVGPVRETCEDNPLLAGCPSADEPTVFGPVRETCEDNPLLAGCPSADTGGTSLPPPAAAEPVPANEPQPITRAQFVLLAYCGACHGAALTPAQAGGGINYINDWERLIEAGLIDLCSPESSRIVEVMRTGEMPPPASGLDPVSDADIAVVEAAIELDCRYDY